MPPMFTLNGERSITVSQNKYLPDLANTSAKGSILHASALGNHVVALNKLEDAIELFEKRARIYSDRPEYPIQKL
jgi:hypothetical protein